MNICIVHESEIPPKLYGGTERAIFWLVKELAHLGYFVTLIARKSDGLDGYLGRITVIQTANRNSHEDGHIHDLIPKNTDIVHFFSTPNKPISKPVLITIEGNGKPGEIFHPNTIFVSKNHASRHGASHFVYNGVDPDLFHIGPKENRAVFLAKATWSVKNLQGAKKIAARAHIPLDVCGSRNYPLHLQRFISTAVNPIRSWAGKSEIAYYGMLSDQEKIPVLSRASVLLFPVLWDEPFGIAVVEALMSGCFVVGTELGSLPELVSEDVGFLCPVSNDEQSGIKQITDLDQTVKKLSNAISKKTYSPDQCRAYAIKKFSARAMALNYVDKYQVVLKDKFLHDPKQSPRTLNVDKAFA